MAGSLIPKPLLIFLRVLRTSLVSLTAYKLRSAFVIAATALGIASLTVIVASIDGAQRKALEIVNMFGPDAAFVIGGDIFNRAVGQRTLTLSWNDAERLSQSLPGAYLVVPLRSKRNITVRYGNQKYDVEVIAGSTKNYADAWNWPLIEGRDIDTEDVERGSRIALIGEEPARELFGEASPIGKTIFVQSIPFQVVGRLSTRGFSGGGGNIDNRIIVPLTTLTQRFNLDRKYFRALRVKFLNPDNMAANAENLRGLLRHLHHLKDNEKDDFTILTADEVLKFLTIIKGGLVVFLGVTAAVAMIVGGFVLANLFYLSVSERKAEVGLRRAFGARSSAIMLQFLSEAVFLTIVGAFIGLALGMVLGQFLMRLEILEIRLSWKIFFIGLLSAAAIGVIFGLRPARRAAKLDPIEALKS